MSTAAPPAPLRLGFPWIFGCSSRHVSSTSSTIPPANGPICVLSRRQRRRSGPLRGWFTGDFVDIVDGLARCVRIRHLCRWFRPRKPRSAGRTVDAHDGTGRGGRDPDAWAAHGAWKTRENRKPCGQWTQGFRWKGWGRERRGCSRPPRAKLVGGMLHPHLKAMVGGAFRICLLRGKYSFA